MFKNKWKKEAISARRRHHDDILKQRELTHYWKLQYLEAWKEVSHLNRVVRRKNKLIKRLKDKQNDK